MNKSSFLHHLAIVALLLELYNTAELVKQLPHLMADDNYIRIGHFLNDIDKAVCTIAIERTIKDFIQDQKIGIHIVLHSGQGPPHEEYGQVDPHLLALREILIGEYVPISTLDCFLEFLIDLEIDGKADCREYR